MTQADSARPAPDSTISSGIANDTAPKTFGSETPEEGHAYPCPVRAGKLVGSLLEERYELLELTGIGGMGVVYRAKHVDIDRTVAVKIMHCRLAMEQESVERFRREGKMAGSLSHLNLCSVFDSGRMPKGEPFLVMEFIQGRSLKDYIAEKGSVPEKEAVQIFIQICDGLAHAHEKSLVHRDLKPSNIMLSEGANGFTVKVMDFGIAKAVGLESAEQQQLTKTGEVFGSPLYMSPEQCRGIVDHRSDIYSLGCLMYHTLTGVAPLVGNTAFETMFKHMTEMPAPFALVNYDVEISSDLEAIVFKALNKDPEKRFQSMSELAQALRSLGKTRLSSESKNGEDKPNPSEDDAAKKADDGARQDSEEAENKDAGESKSGAIEKSAPTAVRINDDPLGSDRSAKIISMTVIVLSIVILILILQIMQH